MKRIEVGKLRRALAHGRNVGRLEAAFGRRHSQCDEFSILRLRQGWVQVVEQDRDVAAERAGECRARAAERDVSHLHAGQLQEPDGGEMWALSDT